MTDNTTVLLVRVDEWFQSVGNNPYGLSIIGAGFRLLGRTSADEDIELSTGQILKDMMVSLNIQKGMPSLEENKLKRGVGVIGYREGSPEFISGWFWLDDEIYEEAWRQIRDGRYTNCSVELWIGPTTREGRGFGKGPLWNVEEHKFLAIDGVTLQFVRKAVPREPQPQSPELAPKSRWFGHL
jgi:hypothetical protein